MELWKAYDANRVSIGNTDRIPNDAVGKYFFLINKGIFHYITGICNLQQFGSLITKS